MSKKKIIIGLTCNLYYDIFKDFQDAFRYSLYEDNALAISDAGGTPIILPVLHNKQKIASLLDIIDGLMLVGGNAPISPSLYTTDKPQIMLPSPMLRHDMYNLALIHGSIKRNIPLLGICRGFEMINIAFGGTLCECRSYSKKKSNKATSTKNSHNPKTKQSHIAHRLRVIKNTILEKIVGDNHMFMNSFHKQCVNDLSQDLQANAYSEDGIIEGFEWNNKLKDKRSFMLGLQGHPEMLAVKATAQTKKQAKKIFSYFIQIVSDAKK